LLCVRHDKCPDLQRQYTAEQGREGSWIVGGDAPEISDQLVFAFAVTALQPRSQQDRVLEHCVVGLRPPHTGKFPTERPPDSENESPGTLGTAIGGSTNSDTLPPRRFKLSGRNDFGAATARTTRSSTADRLNEGKRKPTEASLFARPRFEFPFKSTQAG
jgi:hypothetical protein